MEQKTDIADMVPKGLGAYWLLFGVGIASIGLLEFAFFKASALAETLGVASIEPLDLTRRNCLLGWAASLTLLLTAAVAMLNFRLGKRFKDPAGKINPWFWTAMVLLFLSMDLQVGVRDSFREIMVALTGATLYADGMAWWLAVYAFVFGVLGTRLLLATARYTPAMGLFVLAVAGVLAGRLIQAGLVALPLDPRPLAGLQAAVDAVAVLVLFLAFTLFARWQIFRDPDVALKWFAKVWHQPDMLRQPDAEPVAPAKTEPESKTEPNPEPETVVAAVVKTEPPASPSVPTSPCSTTPSPVAKAMAGRPLVQKTAETALSPDAGAADVVPFRSATDPSSKAADTDEFDLTGIA